ncbi:hypothetical protein JET14_13320 [Martelella lutilitoris]|uniref:Uncharacterized protein n=1 Tax=Martelella lutilitoris TaxID=2583532 RepID=A0A7T7HHJ2_9HYPH|nr:hypothetical protein [Martelella lutilitoris]QQM29306.1 hypothetical protein JET14_13320 [Martelella lutilitoris]
MVCAACLKRRKMIEEARKREGVKGVLKIAPAVIKDTIKNPPNIRGKYGR